MTTRTQYTRAATLSDGANPAAVVRGRARGAPLYTTIPVGPKPVAAAVLAV